MTRHEAERAVIKADERLGSWMSAALDDPNVCAEMKADIANWFEHSWKVATPEPNAAERAVIEAARECAKNWMTHGSDTAGALDRLVKITATLDALPPETAEEKAQRVREMLADEETAKAFVSALDDEDEYWDGAYGSERGMTLHLISRAIEEAKNDD